jgi:hypothetical protein
MVFQAGHGQTIFKQYTFFKLPFLMDYQNQKATIKPNDAFIWKSEQGSLE